MIYVQKAVLDSVLGANLATQDLSRTITLLDGPPRPVSQFAPQVPAIQEIHQWREQGKQRPGTGLVSYAEGALPNTAAKAPVPAQNTTCRSGVTAQVTDEMAAVWHGGSRNWTLADGVEERLFQEALDYETVLATELVLDEIEYMHEFGDSSNPQGPGVFPGGQTDGLYKWVSTFGYNVWTAGGGTAPAGTTPFAESQVRDAARYIATGYPTVLPDTILIPQELQVDFNTFVGGGAGRPLVTVVNGDASGLTAGNRVAKYDTGFSVVDIRPAPYLSPSRNPNLSHAAAILYNKEMVRHASLIALSATGLAKTDTSVKRMVTATYAQEHRAPNHAAIIPNIASAVA